MEWYSFQRTKQNTVTQLIRRSVFPYVFFADSCNSSRNSSTVKWSIAIVTQRFLPPFSVPLFSNLKYFTTVRFRLRLFKNSMVHLTDKCQIPGMVSVNDFWLPSRLQEVLFHHGSFSCQILFHDSVSVIVSRFTSLNLDFVLCCYQFSEILLLEVWLHLCVSCTESK